MTTQPVDDLSDLIHEEQCSRNQPCGYEHDGSSHNEYYHERASVLFGRLEPKIGAANTFFCVQAILQELW